MFEALSAETVWGKGVQECSQACNLDLKPRWDKSVQREALPLLFGSHRFSLIAHCYCLIKPSLSYRCNNQYGNRDSLLLCKLLHRCYFERKHERHVICNNPLYKWLQIDILSEIMPVLNGLFGFVSHRLTAHSTCNLSAEVCVSINASLSIF